MLRIYQTIVTIVCALVFAVDVRIINAAVKQQVSAIKVKKEVNSANLANKNLCGRVILMISGPSGVGKGTMITEFIEKHNEVKKIISATTRTKRRGEVDGIDYHFMSKSTFDKIDKKNGFIEKMAVYGNDYGVLREDIINAVKTNKDMIIEADVNGIREMKQNPVFEDNNIKIVTIYLAPDSIKECERRLRSRGTETEDTIKQRMKQIVEHLKGYNEYEYVLRSISKDQTYTDFETIYHNIQLKRQTCLNADKHIASLKEEYYTKFN